jgi:FKBP-type peptidyl-prolyl cis-trans isomerase FkpA
VKPAPKPASPAALTTDDQKTIYSVGVLAYMRMLAPFNLSAAELELVKKGMSDAAAGKPAVDLNTWGPKIQGLAQARAAGVQAKASQAAVGEKASSAAFLAKAATESGVVKLPSGVIYKELTPGSGAQPISSDTVKVNYRGTLINGKEFDSSYKRNEPAEFPLTGVIKCWTEGVQKMKVGGKARLVCPSDVAYGDTGHPPDIPGGATLIFEIELLKVNGK